MLPAQQAEKVDSAFALGTFKPGKKLIADMGTVTVCAVMTGAGVINVDIRWYFKPRAKDLIFFFVKALFVFDDDVYAVSYLPTLKL